MTPHQNLKCTTLKKLDRMLVNESFMDKYPKVFGVFLPYLISYHSPAILIIKEGAPKKKKLFRYIKEKLKECQNDIDKNPHDDSVKKAAVNTLNAYTEAVKDELGLLIQKAKVNWMKNGDKNTAFFHSILKARKNKNKVESICDERGNRFEGYQLSDQFVKHFEDFLGTSILVDPVNANIFTNTLSMAEAEYMVRDVSEDEIKDALFDIDGDKSPGPDGFSSDFFKKSLECHWKRLLFCYKRIF
ncbi:hypothetical protein Tco_1000532 [Tanacetum coccineum]